MSVIPSFKEFITEGMLSTYKAEKEGKKLTYDNLQGNFDVIIERLIEERIPFYFDCTLEGFQRVGSFSPAVAFLNSAFAFLIA